MTLWDLRYAFESQVPAWVILVVPVTITIALSVVWIHERRIRRLTEEFRRRTGWK